MRECVWPVLAAVVLAGCEVGVVPVTGTDEPFSLYGSLTPQADTQWVRVFPIEDRLQRSTDEPIDALLTSQVLEAGTEHAWTDSVSVDTGGLYSHLYWSAFTAEHGATYRVVATRSDGARSMATVQVPSLARLVMPPRAAAAPRVMRALVAGEVPRLIRIEVTYRYRYRTAFGVDVGYTTVSYENKERRVEGGWYIDVMPSEDLREVQVQLQMGQNETVSLRLTQLVLRLIVANEEWSPPGGEFDPDILVQPGTLSNVENGFGFIGAGYRLSATWVPFDTFLVAY